MQRKGPALCSIPERFFSREEDPGHAVQGFVDRAEPRPKTLGRSPCPAGAARKRREVMLHRNGFTEEKEPWGQEGSRARFSSRVSCLCSSPS